MSVPLPFCPKCKTAKLVKTDPFGQPPQQPEQKYCDRCFEWVVPEWGKFNKSKRGATK